MPCAAPAERLSRLPAKVKGTAKVSAAKLTGADRAHPPCGPGRGGLGPAIHRPRGIMSSSAPFFIVGCGRSGTTLLRLILSGHSRIHILPETWFVEPLVRQLPLTDPLTPAQVQNAIAI